jgi:hypothetical protein
MGLFSKYHNPEKVSSDDSDSLMTEMTDYSESPSHSRHTSNSDHLASSSASIFSEATTGTARSNYSSRKSDKAWVHDINKHNLMAKHLYRNCKSNAWLEEKSGDAVIALRTFQGEYIVYPQQDRGETYERAVHGLNVEVTSASRCSNYRFVFELIRT